MSDFAIRVSGLGKHYRLGQRESYRSLRDSLTRLAGAPARFARRVVRGAGRDDQQGRFWAVKDVSFDVSPGEVVGIVGRNGAGKSTLLKLLSRITDPSEGRIVLRGRVGSLLEVGTGFHPELTGRENIFLNGAILGMKRAEIRTRFDAIVDFAEVEKFLDTPVKHYSSGMYTRLAFSVAAHLDPEILLVDEVLAVGDASFQRKCLNKMESVSRRGRTVFFVSHNMPAVTRLCPRAIMMDKGQIYQDGPASQVVSAYLRSGLGTTASREWPERSRAPGNDVVRLRAVRVRTEAGNVEETIDIRSPVAVEVEYDVLGGDRVLVPNLHFFNEDGICLFVAADSGADWKRRPKPPGSYRTTARIPGNFLAEGTIIVRAAISTMDPLIVHVNEPDVLAFQIVDRMEGDSARGDYAGPMPGMIRPLLDWSTDVIAAGSSSS
ncbi:MAG TPA: polysaccharide ABC transporter ATP-binding protein [Polyangia bacterium]|nr:polysaccharide ABC transporter ATP-binding protein [Polyangia bacterium]